MRRREVAAVEAAGSRTRPPQLPPRRGGSSRALPPRAPAPVAPARPGRAASGGP